MDKVISFLRRLRENNHREWFHEHRNEYEEARAQYFTAVNEIISGISLFDPLIHTADAASATFRINRDTRFSHDKTPYKTNFGAFVTPGGRKSMLAGYYFHVEPDDAFISGGIYMPSSESLRKIRTEIFHHTDEFIEIIQNKSFIKNFGGLCGEKLKSSPQGFPRDFQHVELLKFKHYYVMHSISEKILFNDRLPHTAIALFKEMYPFISFINRCLIED